MLQGQLFEQGKTKFDILVQKHVRDMSALCSDQKLQKPSLPIGAGGASSAEDSFLNPELACLRD
eukprot:1149604-Pelagomonas_calceolata.AAC.5